MGPILVFGHKNPDNDSVCSAVAYAHLKNLTDPASVYVPAVLGPVPRETRALFERFGVALPEEVAHVRTRVGDVMTPDPVTVGVGEPMAAAGAAMRERGVRALPVVDEAGRSAGLISERVLAERYLHEAGIGGFATMPVSVAAVANTLEGELVCGDATALIAGDVLVAASEPSTLVARLSPGDTVIAGDRARTQPMVLQAGAACLVSSGGFRPPEAVLALAREKGAAVIVTPLDAYVAARRISLSHSVGDLADTEVLTVGPDTLLSVAADDLIASTHREAVVVDPAEKVVGILTRTDVARGVRRRVVLVDHNEAAQSADGIEQAAVVEIVDHHRVGDVQTAGPILFLNLPVGSTATIVAERYAQLGVDVPHAMAGILLGAVLTDTVLLKSPTTTDVDRAVVERLARLVGVDPIDFGMEVFRSRSAGEVFSAEAVVGTDAKEFRIGGLKALIAQYETVDTREVAEHVGAVQAEMQRRLAEGLYDLVVLMVTDIIREGSEIFAVGSTRVVERALDISLGDGSAWMPGVLSRKKQVAAKLVDAGS